LRHHEKELVRNSFSYHYDDPFCFLKVEKAVYAFLSDLNQSYSREIVYVCIGTDRATGDSLGPLVGTKFKRLAPSANIYGTLKNPTHASNLQEVIARISSLYVNPLIVAVDACLGKLDRVGFINIISGGLKPGTALGKGLPEVGDFHVSGVVNVGGFLEHMVLQNTRLHTVYKMAGIIAEGLFLAHSRFYQNKIRDSGFC